MKLKEALECIWQNRKYEPKSVIETISHLNTEVQKSLKAFLQNDKKEGKKELEDALSCLLISMKLLDMDIEDVIYRQIEQMQTDANRIIYIYSDKVEMLVDNEIKGGWNIYSQEDVYDAQKMAKELKCKLVFAAGTQLSLKDMVNNENQAK